MQFKTRNVQSGGVRVHITIENKELYETITNQLVDKLFDTIHQSVVDEIKNNDEILSAEQVWKKCFPAYKQLSTCRKHFLDRRDFPKIKRGNRTYYSLKQVNEYLKTAK